MHQKTDSWDDEIEGFYDHLDQAKNNVYHKKCF